MLAAAALMLPAAAQRDEPLPPEQAFRFSAYMEGGEAVVSYQMPAGIYVYQNRILLTTATPGLQMGTLQLPPGAAHEDEFFGRTTVYYDEVTVRAAVIGSGDFELLARVQGCDEQIGICYPPFDQVAMLSAGSGSSGGSAFAASADEAGTLAAAIAANNLLWVIAIFFVLGIGLSFTPCVLPMLPILLGIVGGRNPSRRQIVIRTAQYIGGVVLAFTAFGILAALSGQLLAAAFQQPWVLITIALLFILLAASLFGAYQLQMPAFIRNRAAGIGGGGAFTMGVISTVVVSPCVAAPLVGALLYIGHSGDVVAGGLALASLALGMSVLLAVAGIAGGEVLPRAGAWMDQIKHFFGVLLLLVAIWVASPLLPPPVQLIGYGLLLLFGGLLLHPPAAAERAHDVKRQLVRALSIAAMVWGGSMLIGAAGGSRDVLTPLSPFFSRGGGAAETLPFRPVKTVAELQRITAAAGQPVMIDFYADWCVSCKEFERFTLSDERVIARLRPMALLRADVTANDAADQELLRHFGLFGPPAILFYDAAGQQISGVRIVGYQNADTFLETLALAGL